MNKELELELSSLRFLVPTGFEIVGQKGSVLISAESLCLESSKLSNNHNVVLIFQKDSLSLVHRNASS